MKLTIESKQVTIGGCVSIQITDLKPLSPVAIIPKVEGIELSEARPTCNDKGTIEVSIPIPNLSHLQGKSVSLCIKEVQEKGLLREETFTNCAIIS